jgi:hypothetical protein
MSARKTYLTILMALVGFNIFQTAFHREGSGSKECGSWVRPVIEQSDGSEKIGWFLGADDPYCALQMSGRFSELIFSALVLGAIAIAVSLADDSDRTSQLARTVKDLSQQLLRNDRNQRLTSDKATNPFRPHSDFELKKPAPTESAETSPSTNDLRGSTLPMKYQFKDTKYDVHQTRAIPGDKFVVLRWEGPSTNYFVFVSGDNFQTQNHFSCYGTSTTVNDLVNGKNYQFKIRQYESDDIPTGLTYPTVTATPHNPT